jgi:hypothetical protein
MGPVAAEPSMAKKKTSKTASSAPTKGDERVSILLYKGSRAYRDWLALASKSKRMPVTVIADVAIAEWAERNGLEPPPER